MAGNIVNDNKSSNKPRDMFNRQLAHKWVCFWNQVFAKSLHKMSDNERTGPAADDELSLPKGDLI